MSDTSSGESLTPTRYAIRCTLHGLIYLTKEEYDRQMAQPDALWICPRCGRRAQFDDAMYETQ